MNQFFLLFLLLLPFPGFGQERNLDLINYFETLVRAASRLDIKIAARKTAPGKIAIRNDIEKALAETDVSSDILQDISKEIWSLYFPDFKKSDHGEYTAKSLGIDKQTELILRVPFFSILEFETWLIEYNDTSFLKDRLKRKSFLNFVRLELVRSSLSYCKERSSQLETMLCQARLKTLLSNTLAREVLGNLRKGEKRWPEQLATHIALARLAEFAKSQDIKSLDPSLSWKRMKGEIFTLKSNNTESEQEILVPDPNESLEENLDISPQKIQMVFSYVLSLLALQAIDWFESYKIAPICIAKMILLNVIPGSGQVSDGEIRFFESFFMKKTGEFALLREIQHYFWGRTKGDSLQQQEGSDFLSAEEEGSRTGASLNKGLHADEGIALLGFLRVLNGKDVSLEISPQEIFGFPTEEEEDYKSNLKDNILLAKLSSYRTNTDVYIARSEILGKKAKFVQEDGSITKGVKSLWPDEFTLRDIVEKCKDALDLVSSNKSILNARKKTDMKVSYYPSKNRNQNPNSCFVSHGGDEGAQLRCTFLQGPELDNLF